MERVQILYSPTCLGFNYDCFRSCAYWGHLLCCGRCSLWSKSISWRLWYRFCYCSSLIVSFSGNTLFFSCSLFHDLFVSVMVLWGTRILLFHLALAISFLLICDEDIWCLIINESEFKWFYKIQFSWILFIVGFLVFIGDRVQVILWWKDFIFSSSFHKWSNAGYFVLINEMRT